MIQSAPERERIMVSSISLAAIFLTLFVSLLIPVITLIIYGVRHRREGVISAWLLGALGFFVMQIVIRTPILGVLGNSGSFLLWAQNNYIFYCLLLACSAAAAEAAGRCLVLLACRKKLNVSRGIAAGLGHGGIEAMLIVGLTYINNLVLAVMINTGSLHNLVDQMKAVGADTSALLAAQEAIITTDPGLFLLAGYERLLTMICQLAMTLCIWYFFRRKKQNWLLKEVAGWLSCYREC